MDWLKNNLSHILSVGLAIVTGLIMIVVFGKGLSLDPKRIPSPLIGQPAKAFSVAILQGSEDLLGHKADSLGMEDLRGVPTIINFWASWCSNCAEEARVFEDFWRKHKGERIHMIGIAVHDSSEAASSFAKELGKTYPIGLDEEGKVALNYGVTGVPETVFIDAGGKVIYKEVGQVNSALLDKMYLTLMNKSRS